MHLNGVKMSFVGKDLQNLSRFIVLEKFGLLWLVCPYPGAICMNITIIYKDLFL